MAKIPHSNLSSVKHLYCERKFTMREIANHLKCSIGAVTYFMRKNGLKRRTFSEEQKIRFEKKIPSYTINKSSNEIEELKVIGTMLYWGEGYKGNIEKPACLVDFANSDPDMILIFLEFLRKVYIIDESKLKIYLYCYSNQDVGRLIDFWSALTGVSSANFTKPYVRSDFNDKKRQMLYGLVHIRYYDKKLLLEIKKMIDCYKVKYLRRSDSGYSSGL